MADLREIQRDLAAALQDESQTNRAQPWIAGDCGFVQRRLRIYRNTAWTAAYRALTAAFPVTRAILGDEWFEEVGRAFFERKGSTSGDLNDFAEGFSDHIERWRLAEAIPYLRDLAELEWAVSVAYGAADAQPVDGRAIIRELAHDPASVRLVWSPAVALVDSVHPIVRIWLIHQRDFDGEFGADLSEAQCALVAREGFKVTVCALAPDEAAFMARSLAGDSLGVALAAGQARDCRFDPGPLLTRAVADYWICGVFQVEIET